MSAYLSTDEKNRLFDSVLAAVGGAYQANREALLSDLPVMFRALMGGNNATDLTALEMHLTRLNETERLDDGRIPLAVFLAKFLRLYGSVAPDREWVRQVLEQVSQSATDSPEVDPPSVDEVKEASIHQDDMLAVAFLRAGYEAAEAVAKLQVPQLLDGNPVVASGSPIIHLGTGWLVAPGLLLTNHHVINARRKGEAPASAADFEKQAVAAEIRFGFDEKGLEGSPAPVLALVAADEALDYALLRIDSGARPALPLSRDLPIAPPGHGAAALNIIQHPNGNPKKVAIRNNLMAGSSDIDIRYFTDTDGGSSGSPVFDDEWRVIGLHRGTSLAPGVKFQGKDSVYINVGTRISAILAHLQEEKKVDAIPF